MPGLQENRLAGGLFYLTDRRWGPAAQSPPLPFHRLPQPLVNLPLVSPPHPPEPGQHIGVQFQRYPLLG